MDDLDLLELEVRTIWGFDENGLGDGTVQVTALTYDGRTRLIPGASAIGPDDASSVTVCRSWLLGPSGTQPSPTGPPRLTSEPGTARPPAGPVRNGRTCLRDNTVRSSLPSRRTASSAWRTALD